MPTGGCQCGAIRYEMGTALLHHALCHCVDCRRSAGAPFVAWAMLPTGEVKLISGEPKVHASSEHGRRHFCGECGTGLFYVNEAMLPGLIDVQSATLDHPDDVPAPSAHIQVAERIGWAKNLHELPEFERYPPMDD
ncbi:Uncharacterized conserved protein [Sphingomonas laterariae]|uniref:Uncharacterized conserved protein n=1 Tax=Edaphosphingomonas laterariae TaxID=861865 RepID=A0A239E195_9SPHN|nr:GFA family protein [Sphingomonas laterariae]SNS38456.1 Uncharacterized conserved protein [Sphingomonas laterariae]